MRRDTSGGAWAILGRTMAFVLIFMASAFGLATTAQAQTVDWVLNATNTPNPIAAGGTISIDVRVENNGTGPAPVTVLNLTIPATTSLQTVSSGVGITGCTPLPATGPNTVTCNVSALPVGGLASVVLGVETTVQGTVTLNASVPTIGDADPANNSVAVNTTVTTGSDFDLSLTGPATAASGSVITYNLVATNTGPDTATSVTLSFPIPSGIANIATPAGCTLAGSTYSCVLPGPIPVNGTVTRSFTGQVSVIGGSTVAAGASVIDGSPADPDSSNNTRTFNTTITDGSDVKIAKSRAPTGTLLVGNTATFTLSPTYTGGGPTGLTVTDTIPTNYSIDSITAPGWICTTSGQAVTCTNAGGGAAGADVSLGTIVIATTVVTESATTVVNSTEITSTGPFDPNTANNTATDGGATINAPTVDLRANKTGPVPALVAVGNSYSFDIHTRNIGNAPFYGRVFMTDNLPVGLEVTGYNLRGWDCSPAASVGTPVVGAQPISCFRDYTLASPLAAGARTPAVTLTATATATGSIVNSMTVTTLNSNIAETNLANNTTTSEVTGSAIGDTADISVLKSALLPTLAVGDVQTFRIEVVNSGPISSSNVTLTDSLSELINSLEGATDAGFISATIAPGLATTSPCTSSGSGTTRVLSCEIADLPFCVAGSGDCPVVTVQVRPGGNAGTRTNDASAISSTTADQNLANNTGSATYNVTARADVTVEKSATPSPATAGQNLIYLVTAKNLDDGLSAAGSVTITDTLPEDVTFISATPSAGTCATTPTVNSTVSCNFGGINNGAQQTVTIIVRPNNITRGTTVRNDVSITTTTPETDSTNNSAFVETFVSNPVFDLLIEKTESVDPVAVGDLTVYTVRVYNNGPSTVENVVVTDNMPLSRIDYQSHTATGGGICTPVVAPGTIGAVLTCSFANIPGGETRFITITGRGVGKGTATNSVSLTSDGFNFDSDPNNNADTESTTVRTKADLQVVSKTAVPSNVNLRDVFDFVVVVRNNSGVGLAEADGVVVSDTLPTNMELVGTPTAVITGATTINTCTGALGGTSFNCSFGTMDSGAEATITVPVRVTAATSLPQVYTNTASVATTSLDIDSTNDANSGSASINSSSLSGTVFYDFNNNGAINAPGDTGLGGVSMTLAGTTADGQPYTRTVLTQANGSYAFNFLPQGNYTITRGAPGVPHVVDGSSTAGDQGGTPASTTIGAIALPANTQATGYLFAVVPTASVGIAKALQTGPTPNADGSFNVAFRLYVTNLSREALTNVIVTDPLSGAAPLFGTYAPLGAPATDALARGSYTVLSSPSGTCGGLNNGFNGAGAQTVASGFTLAAGVSCQIDIALRVQPTVPFPPAQPSGGLFQNQAAVTGEGALSGQTSATNPQLQDLSDNGTNPDPNNSGIANEAGENDPTPVTPAYLSTIALVKTAVTTDLSSPPRLNDTLRYAFAVTNTGDVTLTNITLTDILPDIVLSGGPIASLAPGQTDTTTFTATYVLKQADVNAGQVTNQATVTGTDPFDSPITDLSGATNGDNLALVTPLTPLPSITLIKTATPSFSDPVAVTDTISYAFTIENTGNVTLTNVTLSDILPDIVISGGPIATMEPGDIDSATYTATYSLKQTDLDALQVSNSATATGTPPTGPNVSDLSGATAGDDNPTVVPIGVAPGIQLVKTVDDSDFLDGADVGDALRYSFEITNTGNVTLNNITLSDLLPGIVISGGPILTLAPLGIDSTTFTASYSPTPADFVAKSVDNTATATGAYGPPASGLSISDDDTATGFVVAIEALPEVFPPFSTNGGTTTSILASDTVRGDPATLLNVTISVVASDPQLTLDPFTGLITLAADSPAGTYTVDYEICTIAAPVICDQATETVVQLALPGIKVVKIQNVVDNGDGITGVGDRVDYIITVENTGNTPLENLALVDTLTSLAGTSLVLDSGPTFDSATAASPAGNLEIAETATYLASYTLTIASVTDGGISNTATGTALPVYGPGVPGTPSTINDKSDNGNDLDGNSVDDPTVLVIDPSLAATGLTVTKTTPRGIVERGSVVPYTIEIRNDNPVVSGTLNIVDVLPSGFLYVPNSATLEGVPYAVSVEGRIITWTNVPVPPLTTVTATISARVLTGAQPGEHVNTATIRNPATNGLLAPPATATVRIAPEPVFDCGDVIGKVFDDRNRDGYQNPATDKNSVAKEGEAGIPGVRLAGVDGTIITTDEYGRFHVPCAMLPADRGSNFILKLDTRSLPAGYRITTENPRVVRLTRGKMTEINFGAAITRIVRIDLNVDAFVSDAQGKATLSPGLVNGIANLLPRIAAEAANLRLAYYLGPKADANDVSKARALMSMVERHIRKEWRDIGRVKLTIETTIVRTVE
jgi:uncharacterized repeat protein (TIGR01451 family)